MLPTVTVSGASESQGSFYNDSAFPALFDQYVTQPALGQFFKVTYRGRPSLQIGSKDAVVLYPAGGLEGQGSANALSVQLAPGPNGLLLTIANIDTSFMGMVMGATGVPVQLAIEIQATTQQGLVQSSFSVTQQISPGNSVFTSIPGLYVGPGQATVIVINRGGYTTAITLQAFPQSAN